MSLWRRLLGKDDEGAPTPQRLDYLNEGRALERQGDYASALTSYRLAHRDDPTDPRILLEMAIALTRTGQPDEAVRQYRRALDLDPALSGAHYGLAFLLLKRGEQAPAIEHLRRFLARPPKGADADKWVKHASETLAKLGADAEPAVGTE